MKIHFYCLALMIIALGCKPSHKEQAEKSQTTNQPAQENNGIADGLPMFPKNEMLNLYNNGSYVDYIFNELPFSVSQDDQASIRSNLKMIGEVKPGKISKNCRPIGREFFQVGGDIVHEADIYYSDGCLAYVFLKDGKPTWANGISTEGMNFYGNLINQAKQIRSQAAGNGQ